MNRARTRRLIVLPALLWAALSATPAVADSCAYATIGDGGAGGGISLTAVAGSGAARAAGGGAHHGGGPPDVEDGAGDRVGGNGRGHGHG
ncbi:hypothetical protein AB0J65_27855, partial [Streptomyces toxytricini]